MDNEKVIKGNKAIKLRKMTFSEMKKQNKFKGNNVNKLDENMTNNKLMIDILNYSDIKDSFNDFIFRDKSEKLILNQYNDFEKTIYASRDSFPVFYDKYHKYEELLRKGTLDQTTPTQSFINGCKKQMIFPNPVGIIKREGDENILQLKNYRLGDSYVQALSDSMKYTEHLTQLHLGGNRLTSISVTPLLATIKENSRLFKRIEVLDLSYNIINTQAISTICNFISDPNCEVKELNLEGCLLGDHNVNMLSESIINNLNDKLIYLNLTKNLLNFNSACGLAGVAGQCHNLKVLILAWNDLNNNAAFLIMRQLKSRNEIKIIDFSWNSIGNSLSEYAHAITPKTIQNIDKNDKNKNNPGKGKNEKEKNEKDLKLPKVPEQLNKELITVVKTFKPAKKLLTPMNHSTRFSTYAINFDMEKQVGVSLFSKELGECFKEPGFQLVHLDISHNNINYEESNYIAEQVKQNHTILGIHCDGNEMLIDSLGFISALPKNGKKENFFANSQIYYKISKEPSLKTKINNIRKIKAKNNCWICEGWKETEFRFVIPQKYDRSNPSHIDEVKLHLNFEDFRSTDMINRNGVYICNRMCPPGEILFFYTLNNEIMYHASSHSPLILLNEPFSYSITTKDEEDEDIIVEKKINSLHKMNIPFSSINLDSSFIANLKYCKPRPEKKINIHIRARTPWIFPISIWAAYDYTFEGDSEEYIDEVFEHDFGRISKKRDGKPDEEVLECKKLLRSHFKKIINTYKYYSSLGNSTIWQFTQSGLLEFINNCPGLTDLSYDFNFILLREVEAKAIDKEEKKKTNNKNIPDNLIRHQFMNLLVRVAKDKYLRTKLKPNLLEAVTDSFIDHYCHALTFEHHTWRIERYYNEPVDNFLKAHLPIFNAIYYTYAQKKDPGKKDTWMILDEFNSMCLDIVDNEFPVREIPIMYNYSMRLQVSEINSDKPFNMLFPEFLEAFCRVIDKYSPFPIDQVKDEWSFSKRQEQHLSVKLENILPLLTKLIRNPEFKIVKERFYLPGKEEETGLFRIDLANQFYHSITNVPKKLYIDKKISKKKNSLL